jgi:hypothetical protein
METIVSVSLRIISCFCIGVNTPSMSFTFINGMVFALLRLESHLLFSSRRNSQARAKWFLTPNDKS